MLHLETNRIFTRGNAVKIFSQNHLSLPIFNERRAKWPKLALFRSLCHSRLIPSQHGNSFYTAHSCPDCKRSTFFWSLKCNCCPSAWSHLVNLSPENSSFTHSFVLLYSHSCFVSEFKQLPLRQIFPC